MDRLQLLLDKQECTELVHRVARAIDRCDARLLASLFHPDATDDHGMFSGTASDFVGWVMPVLATMQRTQHCIGQVLVEISGDTAASEAYFVAHHSIGAEGGDVLMIAAGRYLDRFERRGGVWKISHRQAVYDWSNTAPLADGWNRETPGAMTYGRRGEGDASYLYLAPPRA